MLMKMLEAGKYAGATPACREDSIATVVCEPAFDTVDTDSLVRVPVLDLSAACCWCILQQRHLQCCTSLVAEL